MRSRKPIFELGSRQLQVLRFLWDQGEAPVRGLRGSLPDLAYTTILSTLQALETQGWVTHRREGKVHHYRCRVDRAVARTEALVAFRERIYDGDAAALARDASDGLRPATVLGWVQRRQAAA